MCLCIDLRGYVRILVHPVLRVVAPKRCLLPNDFSVADIADPDLCVCVCALDLDLFLHHPLLIAAAPGQPAGPLGLPAQKTVETGPHCGGRRGEYNMCCVEQQQSNHV